MSRSIAEKKPLRLVQKFTEPKTPKGRQRLNSILEAVIDSIAKDGIGNTSYESVGRRVNMHRTHITYYFANWDDMIRAAIRYVIAGGQQALIEELDGVKGWKRKLRVVVSGPFEWFQKNPRYMPAVLFFYYMCSYDREYKKMQTAIQQAGEKRLMSCFEELVREKALTKSKAQSIARSIQAIETGQIISAFTSDYPVPLKRLQASTVKQAFALVEAEL